MQHLLQAETSFYVVEQFELQTNCPLRLLYQSGLSSFTIPPKYLFVDRDLSSRLVTDSVLSEVAICLRSHPIGPLERIAESALRGVAQRLS